MPEVLIIVPSDERSDIRLVFERAGMNVPAALSAPCSIVSLEADPSSGEWKVRLNGPDGAAGCIEQICAAFQKVLGVEGVTVEFRSPADHDGVVCGTWLAEHWDEIVERVSRDTPSFGGWLSQTRAHSDDGVIVVEVPGEVQRAKLVERGCDEAISCAVSEIAGERPHVRIVVGEFDAPREPEPSTAPFESAAASGCAPRSSGVVEESRRLSESEGASKRRRRRPTVTDEGAIRGKLIDEDPQPIADLVQGQKRAVVSGEVFGFEEKRTKSGFTIVTFAITDMSDSITCKFFRDVDEAGFVLADGQWVKVRGDVQYDQYAREIVVAVSDIVPHTAPVRTDTAPEKRVELHFHTKMSAMDSVCNIEDVIRQTAQWGHPAVALTDHGVVQAFPEAFSIARKHKIKLIYGIEAYLIDDSSQENATTYHMTALARDREGLRNLYILVSKSHLEHFYKHPRMPRSEVMEYRSGLLIGSACEAGELYRAILSGASEERIEEIARFYDYLEIMPAENNSFLVRSGRLRDLDDVRQIAVRIYRLGVKLGIPVVATGDVHFMNPSDEIYRRILMAGQDYSDADFQAPLYFHTTDEMLREFEYLGREACREVVIDNPRKIADSVEELQPVPNELATPVIEGAEEDVRSHAVLEARRRYGDPLPKIVEDRLDRELDAIIGHGYAVTYDIAAKLVRKSVDAGYPVGSRGSVGSSLVATMCGITEVNPLPPHYLCPACHYSDFDHGCQVESGYDLPDRTCPRCGAELKKDGQSIPFETFLGFEGDKVPDIDLNFSGEYQGAIHKYAEELFGSDHVFRAGTIATVADRTAYGFVKAYADSHGMIMKQAEISRLARGCTGVKRTTGQHPGGVMIVPRGRDIHEFTPVQHPANDRNSDTITTHFDYKTIHDCLLKLDLLGHDDPTMIRMLTDLTGVDVSSIPMDDPDTLALFSSVESLGLDPNESGMTVGTIAVPEYGTKFVRGMLEATKPRTFAELVRISGLSHGTDVWLNNAQELIASGQARLADVIACRDDIMNRLIADGMPHKTAFKIMERVRKGKGLSDEDEAVMREHQVPEWYIESCKKIKYLFPKAHASAYVTMAFRIAYFKVHYPVQFYAAYFSIRAGDFEASIAGMSIAQIRAAMDQIDGNPDASAKEKNLFTVLEVVAEAKMRGVEFLPVDVMLSDATRFRVEHGALRLPLVTVPSLGESAGRSVLEARAERPFSSVEDVRQRTKLTKSHIDTLKGMGAFGALPDTDQLSLF